MSCAPCGPTVYAIDIPGTQGPPGANGTNGTDGISAFTTVASYDPSPQPVMPYAIQRFVGTLTSGFPTIAYADTSTLVAGMTISGAGIPSGSTIVSVDSPTQITISNNASLNGAHDTLFTQSVTVATTSSTEFIVVGETIIIASWGYMIVTAVGTNSVTVYNPEDPSTGAYDVNATQGTSLAAGKYVVPSGPQGVSGQPEAGALLAANNLNDVIDVPTSRSNLGLGTVATFAQGNGNGSIPRVDDAGGIVANEFVVGAASGIQSVDAATARGLLVLGTSAQRTVGIADTNLPPVDQVAGLQLNEMLVGTASGVKTVDATTARGLLSITAGTLDYLLFRDQRNNAVASSAFPSGSPQIVPINTEVSDTGGHGSIAGNQITLAAGTYTYRFGVVGYKCGGFQGWLYNITDAANITSSFGQVGFSPQDAAQPEFGNQTTLGQGKFVLATSKVIRVMAQCNTSNLGSLFGSPLSFGVGETYSFLELWFQ